MTIIELGESPLMKDIVLSSIDELSTDWLSRVLMTEVVSFTHEKIEGETRKGDEKRGRIYFKGEKGTDLFSY